MGPLAIAIFAGLLSLTSADVGFSDSEAYLVTKISQDNQSLSFSLSEKSVALDHIDLRSKKSFDIGRLQNLIDSSELSLALKSELNDMLWGSLMSGKKSLEFLNALAGILSQYENQEKFEL